MWKYFKEKYTGYHVTLGPSDLLYMPAGFVVADMVMNKTAVIGYRMSILAPAFDSTIAAMHLHRTLGGTSSVVDHVTRLMTAERDAQVAQEVLTVLDSGGEQGDPLKKQEEKPADELQEKPDGNRAQSSEPADGGHLEDDTGDAVEPATPSDCQKGQDVNQGCGGGR